MTISGSCLCGMVRYEVTAFAVHRQLPLLHVQESERQRVRYMGNPEVAEPSAGRPARTTSSAMSQQATSDASAGRCGSTLASMHSGVVGEVALGTVDGNSGDRPREHILVGSKVPWHDITDSLSQYEAWPRDTEG